MTHGGHAGPAPDEPEPAGDPVCWVDRVCITCGALEDGEPPPVCPRCGTPRED